LQWTAAPGLGWRNRARGRRRLGDRECKGQPPPGRACAFFRRRDGIGKGIGGEVDGFVPSVYPWVLFSCCVELIAEELGIVMACARTAGLVYSMFSFGVGVLK
jgi:hypothetical protein